MHPEFALTLLHVISISLLGAVNALIFGMNRQTLKEFQWSNFKVNVELHTFSLRSQTPPRPTNNMCALLQEKKIYALWRKFEMESMMMSNGH